MAVNGPVNPIFLKPIRTTIPEVRPRPPSKEILSFTNISNLLIKAHASLGWHYDTTNHVVVNQPLFKETKCYHCSYPTDDRTDLIQRISQPLGFMEFRNEIGHRDIDKATGRERNKVRRH